MTTQKVAEACALTDTEIIPRLMEAVAKAGMTTTCAKGCFACCREPVETCKAEAEYALEGLSQCERDALTERTRRWLTIVKGNRMLETKETVMYATYWRQMKAWCPFLVDGLCSVYDRRPVSCRTFYALKDPLLRPRRAA